MIAVAVELDSVEVFGIGETGYLVAGIAVVSFVLSSVVVIMVVATYID